MMKSLSFFLSMVVLIMIIFSTPLHSAAEDRTPAAKGVPGVKSTTSPRETEILGTLEKPQFSTELAWQSPLINNLNTSQPHRSFKNEIFRPVQPFLDLEKKSKSK